MKLLRIITVTAVSMLLAVGLFSCSLGLFGGGTGTVSMNITDAPVDNPDITGVYVKINSIEYNLKGEWVTVEDYSGDTYNLLKLTDGEYAEMFENVTLPSGHVSQIRFYVAAANYDSGDPSNQGSYVEFNGGSENGGSESDLFVPSGTQSGLKFTGAFDVPTNGSVSVTADFDLRKSLVQRGTNDSYILRPTIRLVVDDQAGKINGSVTNYSSVVAEDTASLTVYSYEDETWSSDEDAAPADGESRFPDAVSTAQVKDDNSYVLPFLAAGTYDLVVVGVDTDGNYVETLGMQSDVEVTADETTSQNIDVSSLEALQ